MKNSFIISLVVVLLCVNVCNSDSDGHLENTKSGNKDKISISLRANTKSDIVDNKQKALQNNATEVKGSAKVPDVIGTDTNISCVNGSDCKKPDSSDGGGIITGIYTKMAENKEMLLRTLYVLIGVTGIVILYFIVRAWRMRRKRKARKYGIITTPASDLEMAPLGQGDDEEEDDMTVFEMSPKHQAR